MRECEYMPRCRRVARYRLYKVEDDTFVPVSYACKKHAEETAARFGLAKFKIKAKPVSR